VAALRHSLQGWWRREGLVLLVLLSVAMLLIFEQSRRSWALRTEKKIVVQYGLGSELEEHLYRREVEEESLKKAWRLRLIGRQKSGLREPMPSEIESLRGRDHDRTAGRAR